MEGKAAFRSAPLLDRALRAASQRAQTCATLAEALGVSAEDAALYWFTINGLRQGLGHDLPPLLDDSARCWYDPTWHLQALLEEYQINEGLASHYGRIFYDPEGGHLELNLAANEVVRATAIDHGEVDEVRLRRVCVHACEPENGTELLAANAGKILLSIEQYREEPLTPALLDRLYARLVDGIAIDDAASTPVEGLRLLCSFITGEDGPLAGQQGDHCLVLALASLLFLRSAHLFPVGNTVFAFLVYFLLLHRAGYHLSAHLPVLDVLFGAQEEEGRGSSDACGSASEADVSANPGSGTVIFGKFRLPCAPESLAVECDGAYDWTLPFERAVELLVREQRWLMTKLEGMSRRRDRMAAIIDADQSMNARQKEVLVEAMLHSNAEFTYGIHMKRYAVSYPSARSDFGRLMDLGFLQQRDDGLRHFFFASDNLHEVGMAYLREHCAEAYARFYDEAGELRAEFRATEEAPELYNRDIGFYEKALLDKTYTEHYDFRRSPIADSDGLMRRHPNEGE
ncbi:hypothetical protein [uncultured Adlercreutzia sp.]|uniref:hypothetical protein n=1 Tax=uncultured Adlercreutzia sp. TaxID=875803 RepID=UPI0025E5ACFB|nr:hypothetical protein [uncultured Adlercreutzia sp.]